MTAPHMAPRPRDIGRGTTHDAAPKREPVLLVDRGRHQRNLTAQIEHVRATGEGRVAVVVGKSGIGKSAVLEWVQRAAEQAEFSLLNVTGYELDKVRVYGLVKRLFHSLYHLDEEQRKERLGEWYGILAPIFGMSLRQPGEAPEPDNVLHALDAVMHSHVGEHGPLVLVIDDAHWADASSMKWLAQFALRVREYPILVVVSYRPEEYDESLAAPMDTLNRLAGDGLIRLDALSAEGTATVVRRRFPDHHVDDAFVEHTQRCCGGEPQILREVLRFMHEHGIEPTARSLAHHGEAMERHATFAYAESHFKRRFARLSPEARRVAVAISILTPHVTIARVASLAEVTEGVTANASAELFEAEFVTDELAPRFSHPLVRRAVYEHCVEPARRSELHSAAARLLREDGFSAQTAATHVLKVIGEPDPWAVDIACDAARECLASGVPEAGVVYLQHVYDELCPDELRAKVQFNIGRAYFVNNPPKSLAPLRRALEVWGSGDETPDRDLRTTIVVELARSLGFSGDLQEGIALLEREIKLAPVGEVRQRLYADLFMWAAFWEHDGRFSSRAHDLQRLTVRLHTESHTTRTNYSLFALVAWYGVLSGRRLQTTTKFARAALGPEGANKERQGFSWVEEGWGFEIPMVLILTFIYCDLFTEAGALLDQGMAELKANGRQRSHLSYGHAFRGMLLYRMGRLDEARQEATTGLTMAQELGAGTPSKWYAAGTLIQTLIAQGEIEEADRVARMIGFDKPSEYPPARVLPVPAIVLAELRIAQGRHDEVVGPLTDLGERLIAQGMNNPAWCPWGLLLAEALSIEGGRHHDRKKALEVARAAVARADTFYAPVAAGQAKRVAGVIEDNVNAQQALWDAAVALEGVGANYEYAKAVLAYGDRLRKDGHKNDAIGELIRARDTALACGAIPLQAKAARMVDALLEVTSARPIDDGHAMADAWADGYDGVVSPYGIPHREESRHEDEYGGEAGDWPFGGTPTRRPEPD